MRRNNNYFKIVPIIPCLTKNLSALALLLLLACALSLCPWKAQAASFNRDASYYKYEQGQFQNSPVVQALEEDSLDDYDTQPVQIIADPLEPWNRFWFGFNDIFMLYVMSPAYTAYDTITPDVVQGGLSRFFHNLLFPVRFVNSLLQGKFQTAGVEFSRFLVNTTVGMGGFIDVAKRHKTVVPYDPAGEDFGQTLGTWGLGEGFYLVLPFFGPSNLRDAIGRAGDYAMDPTFYLDPALVFSMTSGGLRFNDMGPVITLYEDTKQISVDPYIAMREAYSTFRKNQVLR